MSLSAVNTDDKILVLEGTTDLPAGARLKAELEDRDGKAVSRDSATVRRGTFFFDFDLSPLSEFTTYQVVVTFDPQGCPLSVLTETGWKGEALEDIRRPAKREYRMGDDHTNGIGPSSQDKNSSRRER